MDGVMNDEVHGQSNHPKMGGPQKSTFVKPPVRRSMGQLTVVWKFPFPKVGILWWTTHSLTHSLTHLGNETCKPSQAKPIMSSLENISSSFWPLPVLFPTNFFLSFVRDCYKLVGHLIIFYGYSSPPFYDKSLHTLHKAVSENPTPPPQKKKPPSKEIMWKTPTTIKTKMKKNTQMVNNFYWTKTWSSQGTCLGNKSHVLQRTIY